MKRRTVLAGVGTIGLAGLAGCLDAVGMARHEASPAGVEQPVREATGYQMTAIEEVGIEEELEFEIYSEKIAVTNYLTEHEKAVDLDLGENELVRQRAATFTVLTTPQISIPGFEFNPLDGMSSQELIDLVQDSYDDVSGVEHAEDDEIEILDQTTTRSRFTADAEVAGAELEVDIHVTEAVETDDDLLVTIGVYPVQVRSEEEENVFALMEAITEEVEGEPEEMDDDKLDDFDDDLEDADDNFGDDFTDELDELNR